MRSPKCLLLFLLFSSVLLFTNLYASEPVQRPDIIKDAEIVSVQGNGWIRFIKEKNWLDAVRRQILTAGDSLKTGPYGRMSILFIDDTQIKVHNKTTILIKEVRTSGEKGRTVLGLEVGEIWSRAKKVPDGLRIETPSATAAIRGTDWDILVDEKGTSYLIVLRGSIEFYNDYGKITVQSGEQATAAIGKPPVKIFLVSPRERVQWVISYPFNIVDLIHFYSYRRDKVIEILPSVMEKTEKDPSDIRSKLLLAGLLFDLKERDTSLALFEDVLSADHRNCKALTFSGLLYMDGREKEKARSSFQKALQNCTGDDRTDALIGMAGVHLYDNDIETASHELETLSTHDISPTTGVINAAFQAFLGNFTEAIEILSRYAARYPNDERFPAMSADFYLTLDQGQKAKESIDAALTINPVSSFAYQILGRYYYLEGMGTESEHAYRKSIEIDPSNADALNELGKVLMEKGHYEESLKELTEAIDVNPNDHFYWSRKGTLMNWVEDISDAEKDFKHALDLNPVDYQSLDGLGYIALKEGRPEEAIEYFLQASILEPRFAEPHIFLAIAYYQLEDFSRALEELDLAESLDPKDPLPHIIAYLIYQDTYRPFDSINEAHKGLDLLPNLKSVNPVETTQKGLSNLGAAFLGLGMNEWGTSYAEESFNPYDAASYYFVSQKYEANPYIYVSQNTIGFLLNPISIRYSDRYEDIVPHPQHNLTINTTLGDEDGSLSRTSKIALRGYFRKPWEMAYLFDLENHEYKGYRENGYSKGNFLTLAFGGRPDYKNGFMLWAGISGNKYGEPGPVTKQDYDDNWKDVDITLSTGYNHRFGHNNNLLVNFSYGWIKQEFRNSDPLGSTGLNNAELSFVNRFGLDRTVEFLERGLYDLGPFEGIQTFATDSTGILQFLGFPTVPYSLSPSIDDNPIRSQNVTHEEIGFQIRQLFDIGEHHQFTYGFEYVPTMRFKIKEVNSIRDTGDINGFIDEFFLDGTPYLMHDMEYADSESEYLFDSETKTAYIADRWIPSENLRIDIALFYENFKQKNTIDNTSTDYNALHPRAGFELKFGSRHILRAAYQKHLYPGATISLAPLATAGLFYEWTQLNPGARITDYQMSLESRWTSKFFTAVDVERRDFRKVEFDEENRTYIVSAAINSILTDRIGFFMRYKYADSKNKNGLYEDKALPFLPRHALGTGLVLVFPSYIKAVLSTYYIADQYGDPENIYKLPDFWFTDIAVRWEPVKKHWMFKLAINNLFNENYEIQQYYPAAGRSVFLTAEYRF